MIYIGQHQTENLNDGYMGSGLRIKRAIKKYGIENFEKTILFECRSVEEMNAKEAEIVNEDFIARDDVYNIELGGIGGWTHLSFTSKSNASKTRWNNMTIEQRKHATEKGISMVRGRKHTEEEKQKMSMAVQKYYNDGGVNGMSGKHHSKETKQKMRLSHIKEKNSSFGKMWVCNDRTHETKLIFKTESIPEGWRKGRFYSK